MSDEYKKGYKHGYADAMNWKVQNHLEHLPVAQPAVALEQRSVSEHLEPVGEVSKAEFGDYPVICWRKGYVANIGDKFYTTPPQHSAIARTAAVGEDTRSSAATLCRAWVGLTVEDKMAFLAQDFGGNRLDAMDWAEERLKEKNA